MRPVILPNHAFISLGSNIEPDLNLPLAIQKLSRLGKILAVSGVYQNPALGPSQRPDFLNAAVLMETEYQALGLRHELRTIESELGRVRTEDKYAARTIDLDLCLFNKLIIHSPEFELPDPGIFERAHLAVPLGDLDPGFKHPITDETLDLIASRIRSEAELTPREDIALILRSFVSDAN